MGELIKLRGVHAVTSGFL